MLDSEEEKNKREERLVQELQINFS